MEFNNFLRFAKNISKSRFCESSKFSKNGNPSKIITFFLGGGNRITFTSSSSTTISLFTSLFLPLSWHETWAFFVWKLLKYICPLGVVWIVLRSGGGCVLLSEVIISSLENDKKSRNLIRSNNLFSSQRKIGTGDRLSPPWLHFLVRAMSGLDSCRVQAGFQKMCESCREAIYAGIRNLVKSVNFEKISNFYKIERRPWSDNFIKICILNFFGNIL